MNASSASVITAGRASGSMTRQNSVHSPAPSSRAASSTSRGSMRKDCRINTMPKTDTSSVEISPGYVSTQPTALTSRNRGMTSSIAGSMSVARKAAKMPSRPGNRIRANAYPAAALVSTCPTITQPARIAVFKNTFA